MRKLNDNQRIAKTVEQMYAIFNRFKIDAAHIADIKAACDKYIDVIKAKELERVEAELKRLNEYKKTLMKS